MIAYCETWCEHNSIMSLNLFLIAVSFSVPLSTPLIVLDHQLPKYYRAALLLVLGDGDNYLICHNCSAAPCLV